MYETFYDEKLKRAKRLRESKKYAGPKEIDFTGLDEDKNRYIKKN